MPKQIYFSLKGIHWMKTMTLLQNLLMTIKRMVVVLKLKYPFNTIETSFWWSLISSWCLDGCQRWVSRLVPLSGMSSRQERCPRQPSTPLTGITPPTYTQPSTYLGQAPFHLIVTIFSMHFGSIHKAQYKLQYTNRCIVISKWGYIVLCIHIF